MTGRDSLRAKPRSFLYRYKVAQKIKAIRVTLAAIAKQRSEMNAIGHNIPLSQSTPSRNRANVELSLLTNVEESQISTRDQEKFSIISKLLESNEGEHGWIVSIVGLGGSGKTTLAKHICHENKIKEQFKDKIYWLHVSQEFDLKNLVGKVFEATTKKKSDLHAPQHMVDEISTKLTGEKFLLVLDDAWHQDKTDWKEFMVLLKGRAPGSKLMLTTRDQKVAEAVKSWFIFELAFLPNVESWRFFLNNYGLKEEDLGSELIQLGKEIVNKCGGVPLAIKTLGGILSEKGESTWRAINQSDLWNEGNTEARVFASLIMSYIHLKDHLKECFVFCSIFPKGYEINKNYLVEQWMANGFIKQMNGEQPEFIGSENIDLLVKVGFLQDAGVHWLGHVKMHDLIHDLTRYILKSEVATSVPKNITKGCTKKSRYLSLTSCNKNIESVSFDKVRALCVLKADPSLQKLLKNSCHLRSVVLKCAVGSPFPLFILKLDYLGYLEIHGVTCTQLPDGISNCWNLQSLHFIFCKGFTELPQSIGKLKKLRTLGLSFTDLKSLPQSIGDCRDLQLLQIYRCFMFREMPNTIGKNANLRLLQIVHCKELQQLPSEATGDFRNLETINLDGCTSLGNLPSIFCSHTLRTLNLSKTGLTKLPECITLIDNLQCINLEACHGLVELPRSIGNLKRLETLNLKNCSSLHWMPSGFAQLTCLKRLDLYVVGCGADDARLSDLENLDMLSGNMELKNLPHLMDISDAEKACLKKKNIRNLLLSWSDTAGEEESVSDPGVLDALEPPSSIERLEIKCYRGSRLPCWMSTQSDSSRLERTVLNQTSQPRFFCLIELTLSRMPNLKHARGTLVLPSLKTFNLDNMPNLEELWATTSGLGIGEEEVNEQYCFPVLSHLAIDDCPKLIVKPYFPPSLESLEFKNYDARLRSLSFNEPSFCGREFSMARSSRKEIKISSITWSASDWGFFLPFLTKLESLELCLCKGLTELPESMRGLTSLKRLKIDYCYDLIALPEWLGELRSSEIISINHCPEMGNLPRSIEDLKSLTRLEIRSCNRMTQLPDVIQNLTSLQCLYLSECGALTGVPDGIGKLSALEQLYIYCCSALQTLPSSIQRLASLDDLTILGCPELARRYKKDVVDDRHLVSHIRHVHII